jgi:hypothetical protein
MLIPETDQARNRAHAHALWEAGQPITGTVGELYLVETRGIPKPADGHWPVSIRFHPAIGMPEATGKHLALLCRVRDEAGRFLGIQRVAIAHDGSKASLPVRKATLGGTKGGVVLFGDPNASSVVLMAEGPEDALSGDGACRRCNAGGWRAQVGCADARQIPHLPRAER